MPFYPSFCWTITGGADTLKFYGAFIERGMLFVRFRDGVSDCILRVFVFDGG